MGNVDWKSIKTEYISSEISIREIAEKYGVSVSTVKTRSSKEGWVEARKRFRTNVDTKVTQKVEDASARRRARAILKSQQTALKIGAVLNKVAGKTDQFFMHIVNEYDPDVGSSTECRTFEKADTKAIRDCTAALKDLTVCIKELFGDMAVENTDEEERHTGVTILPQTLEEDRE